MSDEFTIYELAISLRVTWQAHSLSNVGADSIRLLPRRQLLANGVETDACSGNIMKHHHAVLLAEYLEAVGEPLCLACHGRDGRRAALLVNHPDYANRTMSQILTQCGLCDKHGFLVTGKRGSKNGESKDRQRLSKHSLIEFSYDLALPDSQAETTQLTTRTGSMENGGQMLMKKPSRSGTYARCIRYKCVGIGIDTDSWVTHLSDPQVRGLRHKAILSALHDQILSPVGATTSTMLPHITGLEGAIALQLSVGRAPLYSGLSDDFVSVLSSMAREDCLIWSFHSIIEFNKHMNQLITASQPAIPSGQRLKKWIKMIQQN